MITISLSISNVSFKPVYFKGALYLYAKMKNKPVCVNMILLITPRLCNIIKSNKKA